MQLRRRWIAMALVVTFLAPSAAFAAPLPASDVPRRFAAEKGDVAVKTKDDILRDAPTAPIERNRYAAEVGDALIISKIFQGPPSEGQLNAAICIVGIGTISSEPCLVHMLSSPNPAVRYWAAKGLTNIAPALMGVGGGAVKRATVALNSTLAKETSPAVKTQIVRALAALATAPSIDLLIDGMKVLATGLQSSFPDRNTLDATASLVKTFATHAPKANLTAAQKAEAAEALANIASFAIQQELSRNPDDRPADYHTGVLNVINSSLGALNELIGKVVFAPVKDDADTTSLLVGSAVGSPSSGAGQLQNKLLPGTPVPPAIKPPAPK